MENGLLLFSGTPKLGVPVLPRLNFPFLSTQTGTVFEHKRLTLHMSLGVITDFNCIIGEKESYLAMFVWAGHFDV